MNTLSYFDCLLFIIIGLFCLKDRLLKKGDTLSLLLDQVSSKATYLGVVGLGRGLFLFLSTVMHINLFPRYPFFVVSALLGSISVFLLGFWLGYPLLAPFLNDWFKDKQELVKNWHAQVGQEQESLALIATGTGAVHLFLMATPVQWAL